VTLFLRSYIEAYWGTEKWNSVIEDIPVKDLECMMSIKDIPPGLDERYVDQNKNKTE